MNILFRVDASIWIGSGHVMRCLVLADEMREQGWNVKFACLPQKGDMCEFVIARGYEVIKLTAPIECKVPKNTSDYDAWLQRGIKEDAYETIQYLKDIDWLVCDHYAIGEKWQRLIHNTTKVKIIAIDDLVRKHEAEIVIDQTLNRKPDDYQSGELVLTGMDFALLAPQFAEKRILASKRSQFTKPIKVLVTMGGVDLPNASLKVLQALISCSLDTKITVLLSERSPNFKRVAEFSNQYENITHLEFTSEMAELMLTHDVAVGAPGSTSWERACLGLPSIIIPLADNQFEISGQLQKEEVAIKLDLNDIESNFANVFEMVVKNWKAMHYKNLRICDGLGVKRVVETITEFENESNNNM